MKKKLRYLFLTGMLLLHLTIPAFAEVLPTADHWNVTFTAEKKMVSNFTSGNLDETIRGLQPGDKVVFHMKLKNEYSEKTDWYMENKVLSSLEDSVKNASGGAYVYRLVYIDAQKKEKVLFDSDTVGGETVTAAGQGLNQATDALEHYFYLDQLAAGESGTLKLETALDGETQGNDYQDSLADLKMNFAVELTKSAVPDESDTIKKTTTIYTGDDMNLIPYYLAAGIAGLILLVLAISCLQKDKRNIEK